MEALCQINFLLRRYNGLLRHEQCASEAGVGVVCTFPIGHNKTHLSNNIPGYSEYNMSLVSNPAY